MKDEQLEHHSIGSEDGDIDNGIVLEWNARRPRLERNRSIKFRGIDGREESKENITNHSSSQTVSPTLRHGRKKFQVRHKTGFLGFFERGFSFWMQRCIRSLYDKSIFVTVVMLGFGYFILTITFGVLIFVFGLGNDGCVGGMSVNLEDELTKSDLFFLSFSLSWNTFSTVGYGQVFPKNVRGCALVRSICQLESFVGILYASFCGAIFYAQVS